MGIKVRKVARGRTLADHEPAPGQVVRQVFGGDAGHEVVSLVGALAPVNRSAKDRLLITSSRVAGERSSSWATPMCLRCSTAGTLGRILEQSKNYG